MEILKRAKGDSGEIIPWNADKKDVQQEINRRTWKAGYTDRDGQPKVVKVSSTNCSVNRKQYEENYVRIFGHS